MMNYDKIKPYIEQGLISEQSHPEDTDVRIFNYTHKCQYEKAWDDVTMQCRGLIMNVKTGEILARPFPKFFNYCEHVGQGKDVPSGIPVITEKLDGSLGIMYTLRDKVFIATRGSFTSEQAVWATNWWRLNKGPQPYGNEITHLFEIIYPENRIVVNYDFQGLVHIASIDTQTGRQVQHVMPVRRAKQIDATDIASLSQLEEPNAEGFVIYFPASELRLKIKFNEYIRLHRLVTGVSAKVIWDLLRNKQDFTELLENVPDEFYDWVKRVKYDLQMKYELIEDTAKAEFSDIVALADKHHNEFDPDVYEPLSRIWWAGEIKKMTLPHIGFAMLDNKEYSHIIWKMLRPKAEKPFKEDEL